MSIEHKEKEYGLREEAKEFPMMVVIGLSYVCNSKCPHCPYTTSTIRDEYKDTPFMKKKTFKIIADQCGRYGAYIRLTGGGEPLLHPEAVELMEYAKSVGAKVGLITNASLLVSEKARRMLAVNVDMIECSIDANDSDIYAKVRPGLDWDMVVVNVKEAVRMRDEMGSKSRIIVSAVKQKGVDIEAVKKVWEPVVDEVQVRKYLTWDIVEDKSSDSTPYLPPKDKIPCPHLFERLLVDSRGRVILCAFDIKGRTNLGNIHDKTISQIWLGEDFSFYRDKHLKSEGDGIEMCHNCPDWKYRSWKHNYWKIVKTAEGKRRTRSKNTHIDDIEDDMDDC